MYSVVDAFYLFAVICQTTISMDLYHQVFQIFLHSKDCKNVPSVLLNFEFLYIDNSFVHVPVTENKGCLLCHFSISLYDCNAHII